MRVRCSYCRQTYGEKEPLDDDRITHGICRECMSYYGPQWSGESLEGFLDRYEYPVLAVNGTLDHVHVAVCITPSIAVAEWVRAKVGVKAWAWARAKDSAKAWAWATA